MAKAPKVSSYPYPSRFGSHKSMVEYDPLNPQESTIDPNILGLLGVITENRVVCQDENGFYITSRSRLDNGLADPNRYPSNRLGKLYEKATDKK